MNIEKFINCPGLGNLVVGMSGNEEAKSEVVCKGVEESDQKADKGLTACKITLT